MSLRAFHIIFITIVTLFFIGVAVWALYIEKENQDVTLKILGYSCAVAALCLPFYGVSFYKKSANKFN